MAEDDPQNAEHAAFQADFSDYYERGLPPARHQAVEAHLAGCARCRSEYDFFREAMGALSTLHKAHAPQKFDEKVADTIHHRSAGRFFGRRTLGDRVPFELFAVIGLAIALAVFLLVRWSATGALDEPLHRSSPPAPDVKNVLPVP